MRIVLYDDTFTGGNVGTTGLSELIWTWANHLVAIGDDVHIVGPYPNATKPPEGVSVHTFSVSPILYRNVVSRLLIKLRGWREIRKIDNKDIIHTPEYISTAIFSLFSKDTPVILTTPGSIFERIDNVNHYVWSTTQVLKISARLSARNCARIIATSAEMEKWWIYAGAKPSKVIMIPLGVDTEVFRHIPEAKSRLGWTEGVDILFVGALRYENGAEQLIQAMQLVTQSLGDVTLNIVGAGPDMEKLVALSNRLGLGKHIRWHGHLPYEELPHYYSASDLFVFPRLSRLTPRVLLQAMACGTPVVTSNYGGFIDFISDGRTGYLVDPLDSSQIANRAVQILQDNVLRAAVARNAVEYVEKNLDWRVLIERTRQEVYRPVIGVA
jgi:glycosyltransferase involved in cell wall biosynthesis